MNNKLGAVPISSDILGKANIGIWAVEVDEDCDPRMYGDATMLKLLGATEDISPEDVFRIWYGNIDPGSVNLVNNTVAEMAKGEHAEMQYPWHHPDGTTMIVRCGGVRNPNYTMGTRIEGTHQDVTEIMHHDSKQEEAIDKVIAEVIRNSEAAFLIDINDNSVKTLISEPVVRKMIDKAPDYMTAIGGFLKKSVHEADRRFFEELLGKDSDLKNKLDVGQIRSAEYRSNTKGEYSWHRVNINRISERYVIVNFNECDGEVINRTVMHYLMDEYESIYIADLYRNEIRTVIDKKERSYNNRPFSDVVKEFAEGVTQEYQQNVLRFADISYMKGFLGNDDHREVIFSLKEKDEKLWRGTFDAIERENGEVQTVLLTFKSIDDASASEIRYNEQLRKNVSYLHIIETLSEDYDYICHIDIKTNSVTRLYACNAFKDIINLIAPEKDEPYKLDSFFKAIIVPDDFEQFRKNTNREETMKVLEAEGHYYTDFRIVLDEKIQWYRLKFAFENDRKGVLLALYCIDNEKKAEIELEEAYRKAENANKAKTTFLFNMSHDIRTPMNAIIGYNGIALRSMGDTAKVVECLHKANRAGESLLNIINDILEMSRIEAGKFVAEEVSGDVYCSFVQVSDMASEMAAAKNIDLSFKFGKIRNRYVTWDFVHINRIFTNIVGNAIKYTNEGGTVIVRCEQIQCHRAGYAMYSYTIEDNGIGMSKEFQKHVFDQFSREATSTVSKMQGTGLGLALSKSFADMLGATLTCESEQGVGSKFTFTIPCKIRESAEPANVETNETVFDNLPLIGKKILLVEDNEMNREIVLEILREGGMVVTEAEDGGQAVEIVDRIGADAFDAVLMDIQMPFMDGYEATRQIRKHYPDTKLPIIALSANAFEEDRKKSIEAGMDDHLAKPIDVKMLMETLSKYLL